jgi:cysteine-rich repeat protein
MLEGMPILSQAMTNVALLRVRGPAAATVLTLMLLLLGSAGCVFQGKVDPETSLSCSGAGECPTGTACMVEVGRCLVAPADCLIVDDSGGIATPVDDGASCGADRICVDGLCVALACGDGIISGNEGCDDGDANSDGPGSTCQTDCRLPRCNGAVDGESCGDDRICVQGSCVATSCGDGFRNDPEECDEGDANDDALANACRTNCTLPGCGDGALDEGEDCDEGVANSDSVASACRTSCRAFRCGDGVVDRGEVCDDGNIASGDGCRFDCLKIESCGDGALDDGEACDDGNGNDGDLCEQCREIEFSVSVFGLGAASGDPLGADLAPTAIAVDRVGNVYIADVLSSSVLRLDAQSGLLTPYAGTGTFSSIRSSRTAQGAPATAVNAAAVLELAVSGGGDLFMVDTDEYVIRRVDAISGLTVDVAGSGAVVSSGDGGPATQAGLSETGGIVIDGDGNLLIADPVACAVRRVDRRTGIISVIAGTGECGFFGDGGDPRLAHTTPEAVAVDAAGNAYVFDEGNRIRRLVVDPTDRGRFVRIETVVQFTDPGLLADGLVVLPDGSRAWVADRRQHVIREADLIARTTRVLAGTPGVAGFAGDGGYADEATLAKPSDIAVLDANTMFVADSQNGLVRRLDREVGTERWVITTVAGRGLEDVDDFVGYLAPRILQTSEGAVGFRFRDCGGDSDFDIVLAQPSQHQVFLQDGCTGTFRTIAGTGERGFIGDNGPALQATLDTPRGVAIDAAGVVFIADAGSHTVRRVGLDGTITRVAGTGTAGFGGDGGAATSAQLNRPTSVTVDELGRVLIADTGNHRIRRVDPVTGFITTFLGTGEARSGVDGANLAGQTLNEPTALNFLPASLLAQGATGGVLIFAERSGQKIRGVLSISIPGVPLFLQPPQQTTTIAGDGVEGYRDNAVGTSARFSFPRALGLILDTSCPTGCLLALDGVDRVRRVTLTLQSSGLVPQLASSVSTELGGDLPTDDGPLVDVLRTQPVNAGAPLPTGRFQAPAAIAALGDDEALIVDATSGRLRRVVFDLDGTANVTSVAGLPDGLDVDYGVAVSALRARPLSDPAGLVVDDHANPIVVYASERGAHVIRRFTLVDSGDPATWSTELACGRVNQRGALDGACLDARFDSPAGLAIDAEAGLLFVADQDNHVVRRIDLSTDEVTTIAGESGVRGSFGDDIAAQDALLDAPAALALSGSSLFIAEAGNHRVRRLDNVTGPPAEISIHAVLGDGVAASSGEGSPARFFPVNQPEGLAVDDSGNLFATSQQALRFVSAGNGGTVDGDDAVASVYGAPPRARFPEPVTRCLRGVAFLPRKRDVLTIDSCLGLLVRLSRTTVAP